MHDRHSHAVKQLILACSMQAAIVAARQDRQEAIALQLEALLATLQPGFRLAA